MQVSPDGVAIRDEKVFRFAREKDIPLVMLTSGELNTSTSCVYFDVLIEQYFYLTNLVQVVI